MNADTYEGHMMMEALCSVADELGVDHAAYRGYGDIADDCVHAIKALKLKLADAVEGLDPVRRRCEAAEAEVKALEAELSDLEQRYEDLGYELQECGERYAE